MSGYVRPLVQDGIQEYEGTDRHTFLVCCKARILWPAAPE